MPWCLHEELMLYLKLIGTWPSTVIEFRIPKVLTTFFISNFKCLNNLLKIHRLCSAQKNRNLLEKVVKGLGRHGLDLHPLVHPGNGCHLVHVATHDNV